MGFACVVVSSSLKAFILHSFFNAMIVSVGLLAMSYYIYGVGKRIKEKLYVEKFSAISGHIDQT